MPSHQISPEDLKPLIGRPDCPALIDVRVDEDFALDPHLLPTAWRVAHPKISEVIERLGGRRAVVYCQKGLKLSIGAAAMLREAGVEAVSLAGGQFAWRDADLPMLTASRLPAGDLAGNTAWVCPSGPTLHEMAQVWLVRRFADPEARVIYVEAEHVGAVAEKFSATAIPSAGSFLDLAARWELKIPEFSELRDILSEQSSGIRSGLSALFRGLKRLHHQDHELEQAALPLLDAVFASISHKEASA